MSSPYDPNLSYLPKGPQRLVFVEADRAPTSADTKYRDGSFYKVETIWRDKSQTPPEFWILADINNTASWIKFTGNTGPLLEFAVPAGTSPVLPDASGTVTYTSTGGTLTITGSTNSINFDLTGGAVALDAIDVDFSTPPGTDPVVPDAFGQVAIYGNTVTNGTNSASPVATHSRAANQLHVDVQLAADRTGAPANPNDAGLCSFDDTVFNVDGNGYVTAVGTGLGQTITGDSGGALSPTAGNWNIVGAGNITTSGSGSTLTITDGGTSFQSMNVQVFTSGGTYTPTSGMVYCIIEVQGAGGGGGATSTTGAGTVSAGAGGGGGGYARGLFTAATIGASQSVTIGSGGAGGTSGGTGSTGGTTSVGALISGSGGEGGAGSGAFAGSAVQGGSGGGATGGDFQVGGHAGNPSLATTAAGISGSGGACYLGSLRKANTAQSGGGAAAGGAGSNYGGGGAGALTMQSAAGQSGGAGAGGIVVITEFVS